MHSPLRLKKLNPLPRQVALKTGAYPLVFIVLSGGQPMTPSGQDTNHSQVSLQQMLVLIYTAESPGASRVK